VPTYAAFLRAINLGSHNKLAMPKLREIVEGLPATDVSTHVQSGNVVLSSRKRPATLERELPGLLQERFGFAIPVTARSGEELAAIIEHDPIPGAAAEPKLYQVTFLAEPAPEEAVHRLRELAVGEERIVAHGRELYTFHPDGIARSKLAAALSVQSLGQATARNWRTVTTLRQMVQGSSA
jgi:uncharacterized protein (DUF1697 family)